MTVLIRDSHLNFVVILLRCDLPSVYLTMIFQKCADLLVTVLKLRQCYYFVSSLNN